MALLITDTLDLTRMSFCQIAFNIATPPCSYSTDYHISATELGQEMTHMQITSNHGRYAITVL